MNSKFLLLIFLTSLLMKSTTGSYIECYHCNVWAEKCEDADTLTCESLNLKANCYVALVQNKTSDSYTHMKGCIMSDFNAIQTPCEELNRDLNEDIKNKALEIEACYSCQYDKCNSDILNAKAGSSSCFGLLSTQLFEIFLFVLFFHV